MTTRIVGVGVASAVLALSVSGAARPRRSEPVEHLTATAVEMTSPARLRTRTLEIFITRWSDYVERRALGAALLAHGPAAFLDRLCNTSPAGIVYTADGLEFTLRYAWSASGSDGGRRIFLASDQPLAFFGSTLRPRSTFEASTFLELEIDRNGYGVGKLSEAPRLSFDEAANLIEMRDAASRPAALIWVRSVRPPVD